MRSQHILAGVAGAGYAAASVDVARTPPMGFNNWARFMCDLNETLFKDTADAMATNGLLDAGYDRLALDDCWMNRERAANGSLMWNTTLFPSGLPNLSKYVHDRGFNFGIYQDAGTATCGGYPGSYGYEEIDAKDFTDWRIDYLKLDGCNVNTEEGLDSQGTYKRIYSQWHDILSAQEHPLIFSESAPAYFCDADDLTDWYRVMDWVPGYGELARHLWDIAVYGGNNTWSSILGNYGAQVKLARYQKPGYFNDPDYIIPDWPDLTIDEKKSQFALWCAFGAPLIISAYIPDLTEEELAYLTNKNLIEVDQDAKAEQATLVSQDGTWDILTKSLANGDRIVAALNRGAETAHQTISMMRLGLNPASKDSYKVRELWTGETTSASTEVDTGDIVSHGTAIFRISSKHSAAVIPTGMIFNTKSNLCLDGTSGGNTVECDASDGQVWQAREDGTLRTLADTDSCLTETEGHELETTACEEGNTSQQWKYVLHGTVINVNSERCLTGGMAGPVRVEACGGRDNEQVFALPAGVAVN
ncbi:related to Probable alpha-galactosidase A [Cephalotrichum gorgonifer]|uniref:Alpha-galactosidase n=1 Tax=Cephalotrichum gorgonifer TaxID=2041049 RepID=A0AAE8MYH7_9PEZI|nr:related to Probable alpha-galactosidase A [Cephalotrichum gorgonifer]